MRPPEDPEQRCRFESDGGYWEVQPQGRLPFALPPSRHCRVTATPQTNKQTFHFNHHTLVAQPCAHSHSMSIHSTTTYSNMPGNTPQLNLTLRHQESSRSVLKQSYHT